MIGFCAGNCTTNFGGVKRRGQNLIHKAQFSLCVCFNSSETAKGTRIKLGMIDHYPVVSVIYS